MKLIIFDFDGPINDLIEAKKKTIFQLAVTGGLVFSKQAVWELINYIDQIYETEKILDYAKLIAISLEKLAKDGVIKITESQSEVFASKFAQELNNNIKLNLEIETIIRELKENQPNLKVCIYTSQKHDYVQKLLSAFRFDKAVIDKVYDRDSFSEPKPSTKNLKLICLDFVCQPNEAVIIGDNVAVDLAPGAFLGMKTILFNQFVDNSVQSAGELRDVLQKAD